MTSVRRRPAPLRVDHSDASRSSDSHVPEGDHEGQGLADGGPGVDIGHNGVGRNRTEEDRRSFVAAVRALRTGTGALNLSERTLMVAGGVLAPLGVLFVLLGWIGASRTPNLFEQIPYLISGGLLGLALVFLGAFLYFAHWITELVKEGRAQSAALLEAVESLRQEVAESRAPAAAAAVTAATIRTDSNGVLVATHRGSMAHRPECVVVAGKDDLRSVAVEDSLMPCKLCDPEGNN